MNIPILNPVSIRLLPPISSKKSSIPPPILGKSVPHYEGSNFTGSLAFL